MISTVSSKEAEGLMFSVLDSELYCGKLTSCEENSTCLV